jgi:CheY-like chemotaxis protein
MNFKNLLLVDDDSVFTFLNRKILEKLGITAAIDTAPNGQEALDLINSGYVKTSSLPDVILLDLNMPVMDGFSFIEEFRRLNLNGHDNVEIIIVTSSEDTRDLERAKELGIEQVLTKPLTDQALRTALLRSADKNTAQ